MKILLRNQQTKLYYAGENQWSADLERAVPFATSLIAWKSVLRNPGEAMELVYAFEDPQEESLSVPIIHP